MLHQPSGHRARDPTLAIPWPVPAGDVLLSDKDVVLPRLADCTDWFSA